MRELLKVKTLSNFPNQKNRTVLISYQKDGDACFDLVCAVYPYIEVAQNVVSKVFTGIAVEIPSGFELQIRPRSGLALKYGITIVNSPGTIDSGYRGEILIPMTKLTPGNLRFFPGDRIAQAKLSPVTEASIQFVDNLSESERGSGGFGHTGV